MAEQDFGLSFNLMDVRACYYDVCIICIHYEVNSCIYIWEIIYINLINRRGPIVQGIFAKIGPDLELRWWDLISSPVDSIHASGSGSFLLAVIYTGTTKMPHFVIFEATFSKFSGN